MQLLASVPSRLIFLPLVFPLSDPPFPSSLLSGDTHKFESQYLFKLGSFPLPLSSSFLRVSDPVASPFFLSSPLPLLSVGGTLEECPQTYHDRSPINFAEKITASLLILQGLDDKVVPPGQARVRRFPRTVSALSAVFPKPG